MQNEMNQDHDKRPLVLNREAKRTVAGLIGTSIPKLPKSVPPGSMCLFWPIYGLFGVVTVYSSPEPGVMGSHRGLSLRKIALQMTGRHEAGTNCVLKLLVSSSTFRPYPTDRTVSYSFLNDVYLFSLM